MKFGPVILLFLIGASGCNANDERMLHDLEGPAQHGSPEAQYHLGMFYNNGIGTNIDKGKAFEWFSKSATNGDPLAHYKLGCYYAGQAEGVIPLDPGLALQHKLTAAKAGYSFAQYDVGTIYYENGQIEEAIEWWEKAANQGDPQSFFTLFDMYYDGRAMAKDLEKAYRYLKIIEKNSDSKQKQEIRQTVAAIKAELSDDQIKASDTWVKGWKAERSDLTIRATSGIEDTRKVIRNTAGAE